MEDDRANIKLQIYTTKIENNRPLDFFEVPYPSL